VDPQTEEIGLQIITKIMPPYTYIYIYYMYIYIYPSVDPPQMDHSQTEEIELKTITIAKLAFTGDPKTFDRVLRESQQSQNSFHESQRSPRNSKERGVAKGEIL